MTPLAKLILGVAILLLPAVVHGQLKAPSNMVKKFQGFKVKEKFTADTIIYYSGSADVALRPALNEKINLAAEDFQRIVMSGNATDEDYQDQIKIGLERFSDIYDSLDTEDRERICAYFEELMDIVGLESSGGYLNRFMYGFDPTVKP